MAAQLNSRVSDLVATQATREVDKAGTQVQQTQAHHPDVAKLQQKVVDLSVELRDVRREMGAHGKSSQVETGAHRLRISSVLFVSCAMLCSVLRCIELTKIVSC